MIGRRRLALIGILFVAAWLGGCGDEGKVKKSEFELTLRGGALPAERQLIRVRQGDDIVLRWSTDQPVRVHLHGYDIEKELTPGTATTMWFVARAAGRFPMTRHRDHEEATLGYLEVYPR